MQIFGLILGLFFGLIIGYSLVDLEFKQTKETNKVLKGVINDLEEELNKANAKAERQDNLIKNYQEENEILLENISELKAKILDLENNIELLVNNSKDEKIKAIITN